MTFAVAIIVLALCIGCEWADRRTASRARERHAERRAEGGHDWAEIRSHTDTPEGQP